MRRWIAGALSVVVIGTAGSIAAWRYAGHWAPSRADFPYQGVEIADANGPVDWAVVRGDGADFVYLVATRGDTREPGFEERWQDAGAAGLRRGAVHVYSLCRLATDQANNFNTMVPRTEDALPPAVAIAFDPGCTARPDRQVVLDELIRYLTMIETHIGKPALLKVTADVEQAYALTRAIRRPLWSVGNYFGPRYGAHGWRMWQASDRRRIDGVATPVAWNVVIR